MLEKFVVRYALKMFLIRTWWFAWGKDQNSDSEDFENDRYAKECNPSPWVGLDFKNCRN